MPEKFPSRNVGELALIISDHITAMLAYWDQGLICRYANNAYVDWFGKTKEQMIDIIHISELLGPLYEKNFPHIKEALLGKKQVFEREIPTPDGSAVRHSLATYIPDIENGKVYGFFVHVADVTPLKVLEKEIASSKRESLRKIIETEEAEKRNLVNILRESVNQKLVACKMMIETNQKTGVNNSLHGEISSSISEIINELNLLSQNLIPSEIEVFGLIEAVEHYIEKLAILHQKTIEVIFEECSIENIELKDKYSTFRILQNFITIALDASNINNIEIRLKYTEPKLKMKFVTDDKLILKKDSKEYHAIACRVDYFSGKITESLNESETVFEIEFSLAG